MTSYDDRIEALEMDDIKDYLISRSNDAEHETLIINKLLKIVNKHERSKIPTIIIVKCLKCGHAKYTITSTIEEYKETLTIRCANCQRESMEIVKPR